MQPIAPVENPIGKSTDDQNLVNKNNDELSNTLNRSSSTTSSSNSSSESSSSDSDNSADDNEVVPTNRTVTAPDNTTTRNSTSRSGRPLYTGLVSRLQSGRYNNTTNIHPRRIATPPQQNVPVLPPFSGSADNERLAIRILTAARFDGYENTLAHGKRTLWFARMTPVDLNVDGIISSYRIITHTIV